MRPSLLALPIALIAGSSTLAHAQTPAADPFTRTVVADFDSPWAMTFLPDGKALVTEKDGRLILLTVDKAKYPDSASWTIPVTGVPKIDSAGQGAL
ncbi:MAG: PQQ-dependent sugar dehydrogenase, partial [Sphingomonas sp.]